MSKSKSLLFALVWLYFVGVNFVFSRFNIDLLKRLCDEDGIVEYLGSIFFLIAAIIFFRLTFLSLHWTNTFFGKSTKINIFFALLGILFFFGFGEEISWGQRIFDWSTPQLFLEYNAQKEMNFHNFWIFKYAGRDRWINSYIGWLLSISKIFSVFWLGYGVIIPVISSISIRVKNYFDYVGLPLPPLYIAGLLISNYISFRIVIALPSIMVEVNSRLNELKETNFAAIFMMLSFHFLSAYNKKKA